MRSKKKLSSIAILLGVCVCLSVCMSISLPCMTSVVQVLRLWLPTPSPVRHGTASCGGISSVPNKEFKVHTSK